jgi:small subunit ribosomal protein S15
MPLNKVEKTEIISKYALHEGDTGSPEIQIAIFSKEIEKLSEHLKSHRKDNNSRRGLLQKVGNRRRMIEYLKGVDEERYKKLAKDLKL